MKPTKDTEDEWMNVEVDASEGTGNAVAATLRPIAEVADDAPEWARYDLEVKVTEYDTREEQE